MLFRSVDGNVGDDCKFAPIALNIIGERDGSYLVDGNVGDDCKFAPIALNDLLILDDTNLYEGKIVG